MKNISREKFIVIFTVFIDVIGIGIIIPIMPVYVESFGVTAITVTMLFAVFSLFSFVSTPLLGAWSDKKGRRPILLLSILSTAIGWFIFASAKSVLFLFIGRIIDGLAAGNFSTAQSAISDLAKDKTDRTKNMGLMGAIFGIGFLIGPLLGGLLSTVSHTFPFYFVGFLSLVNLVLAYFFLPETNKHIDHEKKIHWNPLKPVIRAVRNLKLRKLFVIWFLFNAIAIGANTTFALYLQKMFDYGPFEIGLFFTGIGLIIAFNQGFALQKFWLKKFDEKKLIEMMFITFGLGYAVMSFPSIVFFIIGVILTALGQSILRAAITSEVVGESALNERGEVVGVLTSIMSLASIFAPIIAGFLFEIKSFWPFALGSILSFVSVYIIINRKFEKIPGPTEEVI